MATNSAPIEIAEKPRDGEAWSDMVLRQKMEGNKTEGYSRGIQRSLPDEQKGSKGRDESGHIHQGNTQPLPMAEASYHDMLRESSQRIVEERVREIGMDR